ncbi:hypothetical protein NIES4071_21180 [Calothrix sp. NIES-4071]|nr:hypothetical protein NIES4071_21180 [Calothrix sp. NIES-4071]BAZ56450.1 hypothetical protein NIES4105_21130 [Calothrix sp. NIES-4105]
MFERKNKSFKLDSRVLDALESLAQKRNASVNRYLENLLFSHAKLEGEIPIDAMPIGENRGGKRRNAGRKVTTSKVEN